MSHHVRWTLVTEGLFFVVTLATAAAVAQSPSLTGAIARSLRQLDRTFAPLAATHPWYRLALAIFLHNARPFVGFALAFALVLVLCRRAPRRLAGTVLGLEALAAVLFWLANVAAAGVVVGAVARAQHLAPVRVWLSLLPHGLFEIFAFSWVMVLPLRLAWRWLDGESPARAAAALGRALWPGAPAALAVLALAALIEAGVSPRVLRILVPRAGASLPASSQVHR